MDSGKIQEREIGFMRVGRRGERKDGKIRIYPGRERERGILP